MKICQFIRKKLNESWPLLCSFDGPLVERVGRQLANFIWDLCPSAIYPWMVWPEKCHPDNQLSNRSIRCHWTQKTPLPSGQPNYWWKKEITTLRTTCFQGSRLYQKLRENLAAMINRKYISNSVNCNRIKSTFAAIGVPGYLTSFVENYLSKMTLLYGTHEGPKDYLVTAGVLQGSVLGPML